MHSVDEMIRTRDIYRLCETVGALIHQPVIITGHGDLTLGVNIRIDSFAKLEIGRRMHIGQNVHIASFCHLGVGGGELTIGDGSTCSSHVVVCSGRSVVGDGRSGSPRDPSFRALRQYTEIGRNVTIFAGAIILPGVVIGDGAVIGAGSVVTRDVGANEMWLGSPARFHKRV